jgi:O-methyltransferase
MATGTIQDFAYRPPVAVVAGKRLLDFASRVLPHAAYESCYRFAFSGYRWLIRTLYLRRLVSARVAGRRSEAARARLVHRLMPHSLVGWSGLEETHRAVCEVLERGVPGAIVECGVAQGGCAGLMALANESSAQPRLVWLFDSYEGLPEPGAKDFEGDRTGNHVRPLPRGSCLGTIEQVSELLFRDLRLDPARITLVKGWFDRTLAPNLDRIGAIAILRVDADWYDSVMCCLDVLYDSVSVGGQIIIDDYGTCFGARRAVDEFLGRRSINVEMRSDGRGGVRFEKPRPA